MKETNQPNIIKEKAKAGLSTTLRLAGLLVCPGDCIGTAIFTAISDVAHHQDIQATLPPPNIIEKEYRDNKRQKKKYTIKILGLQ